MRSWGCASCREAVERAMSGIVVAIALPFAVIAGLMASLITYDEMQHHFDHKRALMEAAKTGAVAFLIIFSLSIIAAAVIPALIP